MYFRRVPARDAHGFGDQFPELGRVLRGVQLQPRENAAPDIEVLVGDELAQRVLLPLRPQVGDRLSQPGSLACNCRRQNCPAPRLSSGFRSSTRPGAVPARSAFIPVRSTSIRAVLTRRHTWDRSPQQCSAALPIGDSREAATASR